MNNVRDLAKDYLKNGISPALIKGKLQSPFLPPSPKNVDKLCLSDIESTLVRSIAAACKSRDAAFALSGGVDSTLLVALAARNKIVRNLVAYTASGTGKDLQFAREAAGKLGIELRIVEVPSGEAAIDLHQELTHTANWIVPITGNSVGFATICKAAKLHGFNTIIDGTGAEQIYGGNYSHQGLYWAAAAQQSGLRKEYKTFMEHTATHGLITRAGKKKIQALSRGDQIDFSNFLEGDITNGRLLVWLHQHQTSSKMTGIHISMPFLDKRMLGLTKLPLPEYYPNGYSKSHFRKLLEKHISPDIAWRNDNQGLRWPISQNLRPAMKKIQRVILNSNALSMINPLDAFRFHFHLLSLGEISRLYQFSSALPYIEQRVDQS